MLRLQARTGRGDSGVFNPTEIIQAIVVLIAEQLLKLRIGAVRFLLVLVVVFMGKGEMPLKHQDGEKSEGLRPDVSNEYLKREAFTLNEAGEGGSSKRVPSADCTKHHRALMSTKSNHNRGAPALALWQSSSCRELVSNQPSMNAGGIEVVLFIHS